MATATMNISLPEPLRDFVEDQVEAGGYASVSEYMRELVRQAKAKRDLEQTLLEALDSGDAAEFEPSFFDDLRQFVRNKAQARSTN